MNDAGFHQDTAGTSIPPSTGHGRASALVSGVVAISLLATPSLGTQIGSRTDLSTVMNGTSTNRGVQIQAGRRRQDYEPAMRRIRGLSGLSQRQWGEILGVSHPTIAKWEQRDPAATGRLTALRAELEHARRFHADLPGWLTAALPGMETRPLDLLAGERYRAFRGALRAGVVAPPRIDRERRMAQIKGDMLWPIWEAPAAGDGQS